jgi:hypothetical protein
MKMNHESASSSSNEGSNPMDKLLAKLSEQSAALTKQQEALKSADDCIAYSRTVEYVSAGNNSVPITAAMITPAMESLNNGTAPTTNTASLAGEDTPQPSAEEVLRLKLELEAAKGKIARMDQELAQTRITKHTIDQAIGTPSELDFPMSRQADAASFNHLQQNLNANGRPQSQRDNSWAAQEDSRSEASDTLSASGFNHTRAIWGNGGKPNLGQGPMSGFQPSEALATSQWMNRGYGQPFVESSMQYHGPSMNNFTGARMMHDQDLLVPPPGPRRGNFGGRFANRPVGSFPYAGSNSSYDGYTPASTQYGSNGSIAMSGMGAPMGMSMGMSGGMSNHISNGMSAGLSGGMSGGIYSGYHPQPIGTPLSPHAPEFTSSSAGWKNDVSA